MRPYEHPDLIALDELEELLEAYAQARLSPASPLLARMRRAVLAEAVATEAARRVAAEITAVSTTRRAPFRLPIALPQVRIPAAAFALGFAVVLGTGTGAAVLAAPPGSQFFNARVGLEQLFLPVEIDARLAAHEEHLDARLAEAEAAAARGDATGLAAALAVYDAQVALAIAELGSNADLLAQLEAVLAKHVTILAGLESRVPEQASVDRALENSQNAIVKIKEKAKGGRPSQAPGGQPNEPPGGPPNEPPGGRP